MKEKVKNAVGKEKMGKQVSRKQPVGKQALRVQAAKKKLKEMNLLDDFLFGSVVTCPEIGER